ncbi:MAG: metal ABC transporter permease [Roseivivax sp.]|nr:metal ABC transporter permease [Roseivivax sp.]
MTLLDSFLVRAALAGVGVALAAAPLGCFVVWRRMAYLGDATAHAAILGVALSLALNLPVIAGTLIVAVAVALGVARLSGRTLAADSLLGVMAYSGLAFGLVAVAALPPPRIDPMAYLFGDILSVGKGDLAVIWIGAALVLTLVWARWSALLTATLNADLAAAAGFNPRRESLWLTLALALVVAVAIQVVGALLISALLVIPAVTARGFARTPEQMAILAAALGVTAALGGLAVSYRLDTPTGPTIVCVAAVLFAVLGSLSRLRAQS